MIQSICVWDHALPFHLFTDSLPRICGFLFCKFDEANDVHVHSTPACLFGCMDERMHACDFANLTCLIFNCIFFIYTSLVIYGTVNLLQYWVTSRFFYRVSQSWNKIFHAILGVYGALWLYICSVSTFLWVLEDCLLLPNSCINLFLIGKIRWVNYLYIFVILINHPIYISNYQK